jgi:glycosyltransferase involved in cell wall biosynthesis
LGYVGTISKTRGFPDLIEIIKNLRKDGLAIELIITGSNAEKIDLGSCAWVHFHDVQPLERFSELLQRMDVGVIPYVDREYWGRMSITKMATYMAAGLPIVSLQLTETANILAKWNCGISVDDWDGMADTFRTLYRDKPLLEQLAVNARKAAVEEYNWAKQADRLGALVRNLCNRC